MPSPEHTGPRSKGPPHMGMRDYRIDLIVNTDRLQIVRNTPASHEDPIWYTVTMPEYFTISELDHAASYLPPDAACEMTQEVEGRYYFDFVMSVAA